MGLPTIQGEEAGQEQTMSAEITNPVDTSGRATAQDETTNVARDRGHGWVIATGSDGNAVRVLEIAPRLHQANVEQVIPL